jgi:prepilin-type N-terminal cleavage/methylation domain-containing protein
MRNAKRSPGASGFTLFEMLVVIMIIVIVAGGAVAMLNMFFRGQGIRQAAVLVSGCFTHAKELSATQRKVHFLVFENDTKAGLAWVRICADGNGNHQFDRVEIDKPIDADKLYLPHGVFFQIPAQNWIGWVGVEPNGYCVFRPGYREISAGEFEGDIAADPPVVTGDIVLEMQGQPFKMCLDVERCAGKIRKCHFISE